MPLPALTRNDSSDDWLKAGSAATPRISIASRS